MVDTCQAATLFSQVSYILVTYSKYENELLFNLIVDASLTARNISENI